MIRVFQYFQVRLILLMVLICGLALVAFGLVTWGVILGEKKEQMRLMLTSCALRFTEPLILESNRPDYHTQTQEAARVMTELKNTEVEYAVFNKEGVIVAQSDSWPTDLEIPNDIKSLFDLRKEAGKPETVSIHDPYADSPDSSSEEPRKEDRLPFPRPLRPRDRPPENGSMQNPTDQRRRPPRVPIDMENYSFYDLKGADTTWQTLKISAPGHVLLYAVSKDRMEEEMQAVSKAFVLALPLALAFIGIGAWLVSQQAIRPVNRLAASAENTTVEGLHRRIPESRNAVEFARLTQVYNEMLSRLEHSFAQASRFSSDAAHELNTPITILMGHLDDALQNAVPGSEEQSRYSLLLEEVQRLREIIDKLLLLSRADSGQLKLDKKVFNFSELLMESVEDAREFAPNLEWRININTAISLNGDPNLVRQIVSNLISNSIKYNKPDGYIEVSLTKENHAMVKLQVANSGTEIPEEQAALIFDRFYRIDPSRNRSIKGLGLGLPLAKEFTDLHGGKLELTENSSGRIAFSLLLPV
ncbi:MAG: HAMP domain-containing protein [Verrucomicrobiae bacterium]|nr:HAMP domain-containing protein [Verrucomicrobiae bacterium]